MKSLVAIAIFLVSIPVSSQSFLTNKGEVSFLSKAPLNEFEGKSSQLNGLIDLEKNVLDFYVDLNTLKTGMGLRDSHMRENYLETETYPFAEFTGKMVQLPTLIMGTKTPVKALGTFKIHGEEREVEISGFLTQEQGGKIDLDASFIILLSDYKIPLPKLVFYELAEDQRVTIKATLTQKK